MFDPDYCVYDFIQEKEFKTNIDELRIQLKILNSIVEYLINKQECKQQVGECNMMIKKIILQIKTLRLCAIENLKQ